MEYYQKHASMSRYQQSSLIAISPCPKSKTSNIVLINVLNGGQIENNFKKDQV